MLVNELTGTELLLGRFLRRDGSEQPQPGNSEKLIYEFRESCSKARQAWAAAAFSAAGNDTLERYFTYHLKVMGCLYERIRLSPEYAVNTCSCSPPHSNRRMLETVLNELTSHLLSYFGNYADQNLTAPEAFTAFFLTTRREQLLQLILWVKDRRLPPLLQTSLLEYLGHLAGFDGSFSLSFRQLDYCEKFIAGIAELYSSDCSHGLADALTAKLITLNFNHLGMVAFMQRRINDSLDGLADDQKVSFLVDQAAFYRLAGHNPADSYDPHWPALAVMLADWLSAAIRMREEPSVVITRQGFRAALKFRIKLSVAHLACLVRVFIRESGLEEIPLTEIFKFITDHFSTKKAETISTGSLSKEYYSISQVSAAEVRDLLQRMIKRINREYFPVVAAIGIIIYAG